MGNSFLQVQQLTIFYAYISGGPEVRDRFSGVVEAFARRNVSGHGLHGDHSKHRSKDDGPSSKDAVSTCIVRFFELVSFKILLWSYLILNFCSKLILRDPVALLVMAVLQKGLSYQAAVPTLLVNRVKAAAWSWAVADYLLLRELNQVWSLKHHHLIVLLGQEVAVMIHSGALNSYHLVQEKGNEELTLIKPTLWVSGLGFVPMLFLWEMPYPCWLLCIFSIQCCVIQG